MKQKKRFLGWEDATLFVEKVLWKIVLPSKNKFCLGFYKYYCDDLKIEGEAMGLSLKWIGLWMVLTCSQSLWASGSTGGDHAFPLPLSSYHDSHLGLYDMEIEVVLRALILFLLKLGIRNAPNWRSSLTNTINLDWTKGGEIKIAPWKGEGVFSCSRSQKRHDVE